MLCSRRSVSKLLAHALFACLAIPCWSRALLADPLSQLAIQWEAPPECPSRGALVDELARDLEGSQAPSVRVAAIARVEHSREGAWKVTIVTDSDEGISERIVNSRSCAALLDATSLIVAMMIDPETAATHARTIDREGPTHSTAGSPPSGAIPGPRLSTPPQLGPQANAPSSNSREAPAARFLPPNTSSETRLRWPFTGALALTSGLDGGSLPGVSGVFRGAAALLYGPLRAEGSFGFWVPKNYVANLADLPGGGGKYGKVAALGRVCAEVWKPSVFTVSPCLGIGIAWFSGSANELVQAHSSATLPVAEPNFGALATLGLSRSLAVRFDLDVAVPLNRPRFGYLRGTDERVLYTAAPVSARAGIGLELKFAN